MVKVAPFVTLQRNGASDEAMGLQDPILYHTEGPAGARSAHTVPQTLKRQKSRMLIPHVTSTIVDFKGEVYSKVLDRLRSARDEYNVVQSLQVPRVEVAYVIIIP